MIDTHAHIHDKQYDADRAEVIARARAAGIEQIITVGCDLADSSRALEAARDFRVYASVGIHPHEAKDVPDDITAAFEPFLRDQHVVAIGETGLDYYYDHSPRDAQRRVMRAQIGVARAFGRPVIFHHRDAYDDFIQILRQEWTGEMRGVIHCFTGDAGQAKTYIEEFGLYLGIGGVLTFKTAENIREAVQAIGLRALLLETDCPYLTPVPHRGERNEPRYVALTAAKIAELLRVDLTEVISATTSNANTLFRL